MTTQTQTQNLQVGDLVHVGLPNYIKESCGYKEGEWFMHTFYGSTGTVVSTHMVEEGLPTYTRVFFESIGGDQMLCRSELTSQADGSWTYH
jgi:hypothetical protein